MAVPSWIYDRIFYQIFPDRFANGEEGNDPPNVLEWNISPRVHGFHGGDLKGILQHLDYLQDLGVNAIYLNPIFFSPSPHRYNTVDYYQIDPRLGTLSDFKLLLDTLHANGMRLILDGVFNHTGRGFFAFSDILENQEQSSFKDWYHINHFPVDAYSPGDATDYLGWWKFKSLPKLNTGNPKVRKYIFDVARHWIEFGTDGWRLDVPNEINDDSFWAEFRQMVKETNPEAYLLGEIWEADPRWLGEGHFDGLINYPLRDITLDFANQKLNARETADKLQWLLTLYAPENEHAMFNLLGSHDVDRVWNVMGGDVNRLKLAYTMIFSLPGIPAVYYGDEIGITGGKDPDCRKVFNWNSEYWNHELRNWIKKLIEVRKDREVLQQGDYQRILEEDRYLVFMRNWNDQRLIVGLNASRDSREARLEIGSLGIPEGTHWCDLLGQGTSRVENGQLILTLQPISGSLYQICP